MENKLSNIRLIIVYIMLAVNKNITKTNEKCIILLLFG